MIIDEPSIRHRFEAVCGQLDERGVRLLAAAEARAAGYGGIAAVSRATGIAPGESHFVKRGCCQRDES